jgi:hypothetical protein
MCSMENNSRQPFCLLAQGYFCLTAMFSRVKFLVRKNSSLHVGQRWTRFLQLLQMLWPFVHSCIGGTMYCMQTGHSRSLNRFLSRARDKSSISRTQVSHVSAFCVLTSSMVINKCNTSLRSGHMVYCWFRGKRCSSTHSLSRNKMEVKS